MPFPPVFADVMCPSILCVFGLGALGWMAADVAVEVVLIKRVFEVEWHRALRVGLVMNLVSVVAGLALMPWGLLLAIVSFDDVISLVLSLAFAVPLSTAIEWGMVQYILQPSDPFPFKGLLVINLVGIGVAHLGLQTMPFAFC